MARPGRFTGIVKFTAFPRPDDIGMFLCVGLCTAAAEVFGFGTPVTKITFGVLSLAFIDYNFWLVVRFNRKEAEINQEYRPWLYNKPENAR